MTLISGGPAGPDGAGGAYQNTTDADRAALWRSLGSRQGILDGFGWSTVAGQMAMEFTAGSAVVEERDALGNSGTNRGYHVWAEEDAPVTITFNPADASDRNDAVVIAFCDTEDGSLGTGVSEVGSQIVPVPGEPGVTTPRTDTQINDYIGAGGWFRYLDVPIATTDTEINSANVVEHVEAHASGAVDVSMNSNEDRGASGESSVNFHNTHEVSGGVSIEASATQFYLTSGLWLVNFQLTAEGGDDNWNWAAQLRKNSAGDPNVGDALVLCWATNGPSLRDVSLASSRLVRVDEGDHIELFARNNGPTTTVTILSGANRSFMSARRVGN